MREEILRSLAKRMVNSSNTVIFTGAGMSTESGLPDFRSKGGMWNVSDPMELATVTAMRNNYNKFHSFYSNRFIQMRDAAPNVGHKILAELEALGIVRCIITQNIDGLHAAAGSRTVYELHGSVGKVRCMECGAPSTQEEFIARTPCPECGGYLRPGVVLFGESLPVDALEASWSAAEKSDVFIVMGSSLQVSPANQFPAIAKNAGALLVICNRDITPMDYIADYRTNDGIGEFLTGLKALM